MRRREADEGGSSMSTRKGLTHTCSKCLELGHNRATCKNPVHPKSKMCKGAAGQRTEGPETQSSTVPRQAPRRLASQVPNTNPQVTQKAESFPQASSTRASNCHSRVRRGPNTQYSAMDNLHGSVSASASASVSASASASASSRARARAAATGEGISKAAATATIHGSTQGRSARSSATAHVGGKNASSSASALR
ncbi:uncharacterized protein [Henckelia pumila]|uniref:uncharacterized protein n=1 Tax=Henckelia pumila TaxID=405737 RepID=UPI003C6E3E0C